MNSNQPVESKTLRRLQTSSGAGKILTQCIERFQAEKLQFIQTIGKVSQSKENLQSIIQLNVLPIVIEFARQLDDERVRELSLAIVARLATYDKDVVGRIVHDGLLQSVIVHWQSSSLQMKRQCLNLISIVLKTADPVQLKLAVDVRHLISLSINVLQNGEESHDNVLKELCCNIIRLVVRICDDCPQNLLQHSSISSVTALVNHKDLSVKRCALSTVIEIAKKSQDGAKAVSKNVNIEKMSKLLHVHDGKLLVNDAQLQDSVMQLLSELARQSADMAAQICSQQILPALDIHMFAAEDNFQLAYTASYLLYQCVKQIPAYAEIVMRNIGVQSISEFVAENFKTKDVSFAVLSLGHICQQCPSATVRLVKYDVCTLFSDMIAHYDRVQDSEAQTNLSYLLWVISVLVKDKESIAKAFTGAGFISILLNVVKRRGIQGSRRNSTSQDNAQKTSGEVLKNLYYVIKLLVQFCDEASLLTDLLKSGNIKLQYFSVIKLASILQNNAAARKPFIKAYGLEEVEKLYKQLKLDASLDALNQDLTDDGASNETLENQIGMRQKMLIAVTNIIRCFPEEVINYYDPNYADILAEKVANIDMAKDSAPGKQSSSNKKRGPVYHQNKSRSVSQSVNQQNKSIAVLRKQSLPIQAKIPNYMLGTKASENRKLKSPSSPISSPEITSDDRGSPLHQDIASSLTAASPSSVPTTHKKSVSFEIFNDER
ncbi:hypothetical protein MP228_007264 [Amoeboaphelidium protococcarum]|nr:hypothetical protein MP228_007264 [Amoeboaphelidium protococcarum]